MQAVMFPEIDTITGFLRREIATLSARLGELVRALEEQTMAERNAHERERKQEDSSDLPTKVHAVVTFDEQTVRDGKADAKKDRSVQSSVRWAAWGAFFAASVYGCIAFLQLQEMIKVTGANAQAVEAAQLATKVSATTLRATIDQFHLDQRAWVVVKDPVARIELDQPGEVSVSFTNTGKTPAKNLRLSCNHIIRLSEDVPVAKGIDLGPPGMLVPNGYAFCGPIQLRLLPSGTKVTPPHLETVKRKEAFIFLYGSVTYEDVFSGHHWMTFCFVLNPDASSWHTCNGHNDTGDGDRPPS